MAETDKPLTEAQAEKEVERAQRAVEEANSRLAEARGDLRASVTRDVPRMVVQVMPDAHIQHEGKDYHGSEYGIRLDSEGKPMKDRMLHGKDQGDELELDGPTAIALVMDGKVKIVRSV